VDVNNHSPINDVVANNGPVTKIALIEGRMIVNWTTTRGETLVIGVKVMIEVLGKTTRLVIRVGTWGMLVATGKHNVNLTVLLVVAQNHPLGSVRGVAIAAGRVMVLVIITPSSVKTTVTPSKEITITTTGRKTLAGETIIIPIATNRTVATLTRVTARNSTINGAIGETSTMASLNIENGIMVIKETSSYQFSSVPTPITDVSLL
jgi:hypothetical protein